MRFFLDNCLSPRIARALNELSQPNHEVVHLRERFPQDAPDSVWLAALAQQRRWVIISGDARILKNPQNRAVLKESGLTAFILARGWLNHRFYDQAWRIVRWWPRIIASAEAIQPRVVYAVPVRPTSRLRPA